MLMYFSMSGILLQWRVRIGVNDHCWPNVLRVHVITLGRFTQRFNALDFWLLVENNETWLYLSPVPPFRPAKFSMLPHRYLIRKDQRDRVPCNGRCGRLIHKRSITKSQFASRPEYDRSNNLLVASIGPSASRCSLWRNGAINGFHFQQ